MNKNEVNKNGVRIKNLKVNKKFTSVDLKLVLKTTAISSALMIAVGLPVSMPLMVDSQIKDNTAIYATEISDYNKEIEQYAKYINSLELNDLEVIVKVMNDMWSNIDGYDNPGEYNLPGYFRLSIYKEGKGVCRNMADDFTARMNAINPDYEATNLSVFITDGELNDINVRLATVNDTVIVTENSEVETLENEIPTLETTEVATIENQTENVKDENIEVSTQSKEVVPEVKEDLVEEVVEIPVVTEENNFDTTPFFGNHMVSCIKLKEDNVLLIVDPTNPSIGILKDGKIQMLSAVPNGIELKPLGGLIFGTKAIKEEANKIIESYSTNGDVDSLMKKYGIAAQNEVLDDIIENYDTDNYNIKK